MQGARRFIAAGIAFAIAAGLGAIGADQAFAGAEVCTPCVMVIEVDGLEAKDVTPQTTPFLWALAHSGTGGGNAPSNPLATPTTIGAASTPGVKDRNGFEWAAARGTMTAMTAASTVSLLTGGYGDQSGVFSDEYLFNEAGGQKHALLGDAVDPLSPESRMLDEIVKNETDNQAAAWVGDPRLRGLFADVRYSPVNDAGVNQDGVPAYCYIPENSQTAENQGQNQTFVCPTADLNVINKAQGDLASDDKTGKVTLAYIYLAELGAIKRLHGDVDTTVDPAQTAGVSQSQDAKAVSDQLVQTDAAIGALVNKYANDKPAKWANTVLMVVGNHGYELTPSTQRVPDPGNPDNPGMGLADYVARVGQEHGAKATFVPSGTMGTVYVDPGPNHDATVAALAADLKPGGTVDSDARCHPETAAPLPADTVAGGCISELLATGAVDADGHSTVPDQGEYKVLSVQDKHPSWRLHMVKDGKALGSDGDLVVVMAPGWAAGTLTPFRSNAAGTPDPTGTDEGAITNPYFGSPGGPRNRSIAAIINGPATIVRQVKGTAADSGTALPIAKVSEAALATDNTCPSTLSAGDAVAGNPNLDPGDDANAVGHECQAETVDFAPTMAALLRVSVPDNQLGGRFLQEAFSRQLQAVRGEEEILNIPPDDPPPPPEPDVQVPDPPPPPKGFDYAGLLRRLKATVVDQNGCSWDTARPGAAMDYLKIEGDFGKALSSTTLTFYQRTAPGKATTAVHGAAARHPRALAASNSTRPGKCLAPKAKKASAHKAQAEPALKAIARFSPFALKRGHVKLNLKIPALYRPTHIGMFVQEARRLAVPRVQPDGKPGLTFEAFGPATGAIVKIVDGDRLHDVKPKAAKRRASARKAAKKAGRH